jgi:hypothetical protein
MSSNIRNQDGARAFSPDSTLGWGFQVTDDRVAHYRDRALELRAMARGVKDRTARAMLLQTAREYIALARAIEAHEERPDPEH